MKTPRRIWLGILITGCIAAGLLTPVLRWEIWFWYFRVRERASPVSFETEGWKGYRRQFGVGRTDYWAFKLPVRLRMADDLMSQKVLEGKTRTEVIALLGENVEKHYFQEWDLVYFLTRQGLRPARRSTASELRNRPLPCWSEALPC